MLIKLLNYGIALFVLFSFILSPVYAQGDLMVLPKRLVFDGTQRSEEINLANTGSDTAVYAISFIQYKMTENGSFEEITEPEEGQRFATDYLRYFPRRVVLAPNEAQTVRVQMSRTGDLEQGEYRSHIYFRAVEEQTALGEDQTNEAEGISIKINTVFGISIPVIIRQGENTTQLSLIDIALDRSDENPKLSMVLQRSGNMSVYGDIKVDHISPQGVRKEVGAVKGLSVYTPNKKRNFSFALRNTAGVDLTSGKLNIFYTSDNGKLLSETVFELK